MGLFAGMYKLVYEEGKCAAPMTNFEYWILGSSTGYFAYDFLCMAYFGLLDIDMTLHHLLAIIVWFGAICTDRGGYHFIVCFGVGEISNPAMHLRIIVKYLGLRYTRLYEFLEITYFLTFLFGRQLFLHPVIYNTWVCEEIFLTGKILATIILLQSWLFTYRMTSSINRRLLEIKERNKLGIKLQWT